MSATKYFINPFGQSGDLTPIPNDTQPSGVVSYNEGFPLNYQLPQTNPSALDIPRTQTNQLFLDITKNIQQYQQIGSPNFITSADNGGTDFPYDKYAMVSYDDGVNGFRTFMSKKPSNTDLPTVGASWWFLDNSSGAVVFDACQFDVGVSNGDAVYLDSGTGLFKKALADGTVKQYIVGFADITFKRVFSSGIAYNLTGLTPQKIYYLSTTLLGVITDVLPSTNVVQVGTSTSTTELLVNIQQINYSVIQYNSSIYCVDTGTANAIVGSLNPSITTYGTGGLELLVKISAMNTGNVTANFDGLGLVSVLSENGNQVNPADLMIGMIANLIFDGTNFILSNPSKNVVALRAEMNSDFPFPSDGVARKIIFDNLVLDKNSGYDALTGKFTCIIPGLYNIKSQCNILGSSVTFYEYIYINGVEESASKLVIRNEAGNAWQNSECGLEIELNVGDYVEIFVKTEIADAYLYVDHLYSSFEYYRLY